MIYVFMRLLFNSFCCELPISAVSTKNRKNQVKRCSWIKLNKRIYEMFSPFFATFSYSIMVLAMTIFLLYRFRYFYKINRYYPPGKVGLVRRNISTTQLRLLTSIYLSSHFAITALLPSLPSMKSFQ